MKINNIIKVFYGAKFTDQSNTWKTISATTDRLLSLDILKGLAAIAVIVNHISWIGINKSIFLYRFWVSPAVPVFVVITSFLYSRTFIKIGFDSWYSKENFRHFAKRFGPAALLILVLQFFIEVVRHSIPVSEFIRMILIGGLYGPGGYYVSILLQFICIFPFFFKLSYQKPLLGFVLIVFFEYIIWNNSGYNINEFSLSNFNIPLFRRYLSGRYFIFSLWSPKKNNYPHHSVIFRHFFSCFRRCWLYVYSSKSLEGIIFDFCRAIFFCYCILFHKKWICI